MAKEFKVEKSGKSLDGTFWGMVKGEDKAGFEQSAFLKSKKEIKVGAKLTLDEKALRWQY